MKKIKIRPLFENDWQDLQKIRLEALLKHPDFFSPSRDETLFSEADWKMRILNPNGCIFGIYNQNEIVGITGIVIDKDNSEVAHFVMSYTKNNFRGMNLSALLYSVRIDWAKQQQKIKVLTLDVNESNIPSQSACKKYGFKNTEIFEENGRKILTFTLHL